jgi:hypothetical protein
LCFVGCGRETAPAGDLRIALHPSPNDAFPGYVAVTGLSSDELSSLRDENLDESGWQSVLRVTAGDQPAADVPAVIGTYAVKDDAVTFTPRFPFVPGAKYQVAFDPRTIARDGEPVTEIVGLPPVATEPSTVVTAIYPAADVVPENLLRVYVEFSAPMGNAPGRDFVTLVDRTGGKHEVVEGAFLPVEAEFWSPDHKRYTLILDPGRVKEGILPNRQRGRPLRAGRQYAFEVSPMWTDANRLPLKTGYTHTFRAGPAQKNAIKLSDWKVGEPRAGSSDPLAVNFTLPVDHSIIIRALTVETKNGSIVAGKATLNADATEWRFTPDKAWQAGDYTLVAQSYLEDPQGNQIDHPFEVIVDRTRDESIPESYKIPLTVK